MADSLFRLVGLINTTLRGEEGLRAVFDLPKSSKVRAILRDVVVSPVYLRLRKKVMKNLPKDEPKPSDITDADTPELIDLTNKMMNWNDATSFERQLENIPTSFALYKLSKLIEALVPVMNFQVNFESNSKVITNRKNFRQTYVSERRTTEYSKLTLEKLLQEAINTPPTDEGTLQKMFAHLLNRPLPKPPLAGETYTFTNLETLGNLYQSTMVLIRPYAYLKAEVVKWFDDIFYVIFNDFQAAYSTMTERNPVLLREGLLEVFSNFDNNAYSRDTKDMLAAEVNQLLCVAKGIDPKRFENFSLQENYSDKRYAVYISRIRTHANFLKNALEKVVLCEGPEYYIGRFHHEIWSELYENGIRSPEKFARIYKEACLENSQTRYLIPAYSAKTKWAIHAQHIKIQSSLANTWHVIPLWVNLTRQDNHNEQFFRRRNENMWRLLDREVILGHEDEISLVYYPGISDEDPSLDHDITYKFIGTKKNQVYLKLLKEPVTATEMKSVLQNCGFRNRHPDVNQWFNLNTDDSPSQGGGRGKVAYRGKRYTIRVGKRGASYILVKGKRIYLNSASSPSVIKSSS